MRMARTRKGYRAANPMDGLLGAVRDSRRLIPMVSLKELVQKRLPPGSPFREVIMSEPDHLTPFEFAAKMDTWLKLCSLEESNNRG
jgi:hypothetical protein